MSEEAPYVAINPGEEETFMLWDTCPLCGAKITFSFAELMRCSEDDDRPRPKCSNCGHELEIGHARRLVDGEWVDV